MRHKHNRKILQTPILTDDLLLLITNEVNFGSCGLIQHCHQLSAEIGKTQAEINPPLQPQIKSACKTRVPIFCASNATPKNVGTVVRGRFRMSSPPSLDPRRPPPWRMWLWLRLRLPPPPRPRLALLELPDGIIPPLCTFKKMYYILQGSLRHTSFKFHRFVATSRTYWSAL